VATMKWTEDQLAAITARGGTLLVSAAAGSGKTAVLSERVARLLADEENPLPAGQLLIATFSNAAAAEMRERIEKKLEERVAANPGSRFLREQQQALQSAQIGTIHAFCLQLIRAHYPLLDLPADLRVGDERELQLLRREVLTNLVAGRYEEGDPLFLRTVELFSAARNDNLLLKTVLRLYDFTRSHPFPEAWLEEKLALYQADTPISETIWGKEILSYAQGALRFARGEMLGAAAVMQDDEKLSAAWLPAYQSDLDQLDRTLALAEAGDWDGTLRALRAFTFLKKRPLRGYEGEELKKALDQTRKSCKELVERLRDRTFSATIEQAADDVRDLKPKIALLFSLVREFSEQYSQAKQERRLVDFSDLEQYALRLLCRRGEEGSVEPAGLALSLRKEYAMILVDEYQDTNEAQEMIFWSLSDGCNLFMVGDVKQSIYGFRQASPRIFMEKKDRYHAFDGEHYPARLILGANFRSHPAVCEAVNDFFAACMSRRVGQVDYGEEERLVGLGSFAQNPEAGLSLELIDTSEADEAAALCEARYVADRIAGLLSSGDMVNEDGELRRVRPGDIGILLRTMKGKAELFLKALAERGIPAVSGAQSSFLQTLEISTVLSILRAVNNPLLDIPLVAAMMSPVYAYSAGEVARIRLFRRGEPFYMALLEGERQGDAASVRFLEELRALRTAASDMSVERLIRFLYERTMLPSLALALEGAEERRANLNLLVSYAKGYEKSGCRSLPQFLRLIDDIEENGEDLPPAVVAARENAVQIMSVHRSKGLEFPIVFLCEIQKRFNREDLRKNVLLHASLGFACVRRDEETMSQFATAPYEAVRLALERESSSEEMRILYVALTRAKERLIVTGACDALQRKLQALAVRPQQDGRFPEHAVARSQSWLEWLIMTALCLPGGAPLREYAGLPQPGGIPCRGELRCRVVCSGKREEETAVPAVARPTAEVSAPLLARLERRLASRYPYEAATVIPTKMAVTAMVRSSEEARSYRFQKKPQFITRQKMTAADRGDAFHKFMLFADLRHAAVDPQGETERLIRLRFLSEDEGEAISSKALRAFFRSPLWSRIARAEKIEREFRFMALLGADRLAGCLPQIGEERVTVQGICDLLFFEGEQAVLVDYKTDRVDSGSVLLARYSSQLLLYREILQHSLHIPVKECSLYSTALSQEIPVLLPEN
jgi:ATP-dependent helicase/nuclease subunit A